MFKCRHRSCSYVTLCYIRDRKSWLSYEPNTNVFTWHDLSVEICDIRMHPNTSVGFS